MVEKKKKLFFLSQWLPALTYMYQRENILVALASKWKSLFNL